MNSAKWLSYLPIFTMQSNATSTTINNAFFTCT